MSVQIELAAEVESLRAELAALKPALPDCRKCAKICWYDDEPDCTMEFPEVCVGGDHYLSAAPVRLYQRGGP